MISNPANIIRILIEQAQAKNSKRAVRFLIYFLKKCLLMSVNWDRARIVRLIRLDKDSGQFGY